ncbi:MAG: hypothetical protein ACK5YC_20950, partial [Planctomyces sp.]
IGQQQERQQSPAQSGDAAGRETGDRIRGLKTHYAPRHSDREAKTLGKPAGYGVWAFRAGEQVNGEILSPGSAEVC